MIAYILKMAANLRLHQGLKAQGIDVETLPFKSKWTPYSNYFGIFFVTLILLTNGYGVFTKGYWSFSGFFTAYFTIVFFAVFYVSWKIVKITPSIRAENMNFKTGLEEVELHENIITNKMPASKYDK
ncbi:hypothetical protein F5Y16DRAFT_400351 [Xylariaceae sp. FL0255]|nr:hypothetical protein F5Y16DRAFT_400351 [Xylariaceae sp. FL0255]